MLHETQTTSLGWWTGAIALALTWGCQGPAATVLPPIAPTVESTGSARPVVPNTQVPDDASKQVATMGTVAAPLLAAALSKFAGPIAAYYDARDRHPAARFRVQDVPNWSFDNGWYAYSGNSDEVSLRLGILDAANALFAWDPTLEGNYGPGQHPGFPSEPTSFRLEFQQKLPSGGRMAVTFLAPIPLHRLDPILAYGSGTAEVGPPAGQVVFQALNANFNSQGAIQGGDLTLKSITSGATVQLSGRYDGNGLATPSQLIENGEALGDVTRQDGRWQIRNAGGTYPLM